eukprot:1916409-Rhodomonas_salina.4
MLSGIGSAEPLVAADGRRESRGLDSRSRAAASGARRRNADVARVFGAQMPEGGVLLTPWVLSGEEEERGRRLSDRAALHAYLRAHNVAALPLSFSRALSGSR